MKPTLLAILFAVAIQFVGEMLASATGTQAIAWQLAGAVITTLKALYLPSPKEDVGRQENGREGVE